MFPVNSAMVLRTHIFTCKLWTMGRRATHVPHHKGPTQGLTNERLLDVVTSYCEKKLMFSPSHAKNKIAGGQNHAFSSLNYW